MRVSETEVSTAACFYNEISHEKGMREVRKQRRDRDRRRRHCNSLPTNSGQEEDIMFDRSGYWARHDDDGKIIALVKASVDGSKDKRPRDQLQASGISATGIASRKRRQWQQSQSAKHSQRRTNSRTERYAPYRNVTGTMASHFDAALLRTCQAIFACHKIGALSATRDCKKRA